MYPQKGNGNRNHKEEPDPKYLMHVIELNEDPGSVV